MELFRSYVSLLRFMYLLNQNCHWQCYGQSFYSTHLLFERLYSEIAEDQDKAAERFVGLCGAKNLNFTQQLEEINSIKSGISSENYFVALAETCLKAEKLFQKLTTELKARLTESKDISDGLDDLIMGLANRSESRMYLLGQMLA